MTEQEKEELRNKMEARKQRDAAERTGTMNGNQKMCPDCRSVIPANYDVCPVCGEVMRQVVNQVSNPFEQRGETKQSVQQVQIVNPSQRYCEYCGAGISDGAVVCVNCGHRVVPVRKTGGLYTATKVFLVLACIIQGFFIIPLAWCIPMTVSIFHSFRDGRKVDMAMKICTLLFVSLIAGILLLCIPDDEE